MKRIALCTPNAFSASETFIAAHIKGIVGQVTVYSGGQLPRTINSCEEVIPQSRLRRIAGALLRKLLYPDLSTSEYFLLKSFQARKINMIFAEYGVTGAKLVPLLRHLQIPCIVHFHGYDAYERDVLKQTGNYKQLFEQKPVIISVSDHMKEQLIQLGATPSAVFVTRCGPRQPDSESIHNRKRNRPIHLLSVGRFTNKKAPYYLIHALKDLIHDTPDIVLHMVGDGPLKECCENLARLLNVQENIRFHGALDHDSVLALYESDVIFLQHSITCQNGDREGTPVAVLEAAAYGLPIVASNHTGIGEVFTHQLNALLFQEHDNSAMVGHIRILLSSPELRANLGKKAHELIELNFKLSKHLADLNAIIDSLGVQ